MQNNQNKFQTILSLSELHEQYFMVFLRHQIMLMQKQTDKAAVLLEGLRSTMVKHMNDEEKYLLPVYTEKVNPIPAGGAPEFYLNEHVLLKRKLDIFCKELKKWAGRPLPGIDLVNLFDQHIHFKDLLDHHDARERIFLYRILDEKLSRSEREEILMQFSLTKPS